MNKILSLFLLFPILASCSQEPAIQDTSEGAVLGWIPYWDQENAMKSVKENPELFDYLSVFWYRVDAKGNLTTYEVVEEDRSIIRYAHNNGIKVLALIANLPDYTEEENEWDTNRIQLVTETKEARKEHIDDILSLFDSHDFDGINIDYESLQASQKESFSLFIEELADALHAKGKILGVAIHPKTEEGNPEESNGSQAQDLVRIAKVADQLHFMTYGEHYPGGNPGPIASPQWISKVLGYAVKELKLPREKLFVGIGLYGIDWHHQEDGNFTTGDGELTLGAIETLNLATIQRDTVSQSPWVMESNIELWFEDTQSIAAKIKAAKNLGVNNIAFWRLGGEASDTWSVLRE